MEKRTKENEKKEIEKQTRISRYQILWYIFSFDYLCAICLSCNYW